MGDSGTGRLSSAPSELRQRSDPAGWASLELGEQLYQWAGRRAGRGWQVWTRWIKTGLRHARSRANVAVTKTGPAAAGIQRSAARVSRGALNSPGWPTVLAKCSLAGREGRLGPRWSRRSGTSANAHRCPARDSEIVFEEPCDKMADAWRASRRLRRTGFGRDREATMTAGSCRWWASRPHDRFARRRQARVDPLRSELPTTPSPRSRRSDAPTVTGRSASLRWKARCAGADYVVRAEPCALFCWRRLATRPARVRSDDDRNQVLQYCAASKRRRPSVDSARAVAHAEAFCAPSSKVQRYQFGVQVAHAGVGK